MRKRLLKYSWKVTNRRASQSNLVNCILIDADIFLCLDLEVNV